jgi:xanthine dehydrogenase accessory factor
MPDLLEQLDELRATEKRVAMATLIAARGGSPRPLGAKLFVGAHGRLVGAVSIGGCVDARVVEHGERLLREARWETVTVAVDDVEAIELGLNCGAEFDLLIEPFDLTAPDERLDAYGEAVRLSRSGREAFVTTWLEGVHPKRAVSRQRSESVPGRTFVERFAPADTLVIVGASDVAAALARMARILGMRVVVIDGRERYATRERFPGVEEIHVGIPSELAAPWLTAGAFLVLLTHDYKYELPVLRDALQRDLRFVGMLAGRKRADGIRSALLENGLGAEEVARLHAPVGLDIGGREPEEIAVSIVAQLIAVREGKPIAHRAAGSPRSS